jgi:RNA polymerase sigma factor (sigma-70 family)
MTTSEKQLLDECEDIINRVINKTDLDRSVFEDREEAKQCLRLVVIEEGEALRAATPALRWVILFRRAIDIIRQAAERLSSEVKSVRFDGAPDWHARLLDAGAEPPATPEQEAIANELLAAIIDPLQLSEREVQVLEDRANGVPSQKTGEKFGISSSRVRQILQRVRRKIVLRARRELRWKF